MKQIILNFSPFLIQCALVENGDPKELITINPSVKTQVGNIYAAKVKDVSKKRFAFVSIGGDKNGFLQLDDHRQYALGNISNGQRVLVQVIRDALGDKGAMLSSTLSFSGRLLVLTKSPNNDSHVNISNKIVLKSMRETLKFFCETHCPKDFGIIVRTEAANAGLSQIKDELERLHREALSVIEKAKTAPMPTMLYGSDKVYVRVLHDLLDAGATQIVTNDKGELAHIQELANNYANITDVSFSRNPFDLETHMSRALRQKVWLKSGAYILIEETSACTYIDVNTGKYEGKRDPIAAATMINIEASKEIASQIRLRNISGTIIVDFVGSISASHEGLDELAHAFESALLKDPVPAKIVEWSTLNIATLTRKYRRASLKSTTTHTCPTCSGTGATLSSAFLADKVYKEIIKIYSGDFCGKIRVDAHEDIVRVLESVSEMADLAEVKVAKDATIGFYEIRAK